MKSTINLRRIKRSIKFWWQRRTRGWDDSETWNLDYHTAKFLVPRLIRFKELTNAYPPNLSKNEWDAVLDQMIKSFKSCESCFYDAAALKDGYRLLAEYHSYLWW
jgi:hypothetical protein